VAALWTQKLMKAAKPFTADMVITRMRETVMPLPLDEEDVGRGLVQAPQK